MPRQTTATHYRKRLAVLTDYIYQNIEGDLTLATLAEVALISPYHLHRIYRSIYNDTLTETIKRIRLHYAAGRLLNTDLTVAAIARQARYNSVQSFTRAFSEAFGMPPARYRLEGSHTQFKQSLLNKEKHPMHDVTIRQAQPMTLVGFEHSGSYMEIGQTFDKLYGSLAAKQLLTEHTKAVGIYFDDPETVEASLLRSMACIATNSPDRFPEAEGFKRFDIEGGKCAVLRYKGPYANMDVAYKWLFSQWLPQSGERVGNQPAYEEYLNDPRQVPAPELLTDIYIPLESNN